MKVWAAALLATVPLFPVQAQQTAPPPADASPTAPAPAPSPPPPPAWLNRSSANLTLLNKITARPRSVSVPVGQTVAFGSLTIAVRACLVRPADVPADATAFLDITDSHPDAPGFHGWMLAAEPEVSMLEHPVYDVRVAGCGG